MLELIDRIGISVFIQIVIECYSEIVLLLILFIILIGVVRDKSDELMKKVEIPMTTELIVFYCALILYNISDVIDIVYNSVPTLNARIILHIFIFLYYAIGGSMAMLMLDVMKNRIANKHGGRTVNRIISGLRIMQALLFLLLAATPFTGAIYFVSEKNEYERSWGYWIWQIGTIIIFVFAFIILIIYYKKICYFHKWLITTVTILPLIALVLNIVLPGVSFNNIMISAASLIMFLLYEKNKTDVLIHSVYELEKSRLQLENSRLELEQSKMRILMAQIQPHFIYNSIMALQSKSVDNPDLYNGISDFGKYLRTHFETISDETLISFSDELKSIKAYLNLERLNYGDRLKVEYDIEIDQFMVPALSIEPLVENAVRYGIGTYEQGGVVSIIVRDEQDYTEVEVHDDGSGNHSLTEAQEKRKSIGLENVRLRLQSMDMGELRLKQDEHGTSAIIRFKCEEY